MSDCKLLKWTCRRHMSWLYDNFAIPVYCRHLDQKKRGEKVIFFLPPPRLSDCFTVNWF